ncbi:beta-ketoacyl synthase N-terminal-like domain-containing protein [Photorhabdus tasmaniensis]|uniref:beta-ketoacyl synthase N-terminal-like domain-containing protein n=1 Tax=Photorhabdus sp. RM323S TaxID=3342828 RepID=UPI0036DDFED9
MLNNQEDQTSLDETTIAIVGMSCRFPGASSVTQYWKNLLSGTESIQVNTYTDGGIHSHAELPDIENFDYNFFGFNYKEAQLLDPQHRFLLECAWEVMENTSLHSKSESIGVFCGAGPSSYFINNVHGQSDHSGACGLYQSADTLTQFMATDKEFLANRIAYKFNCCGPAINIQAACATSIFGIQAAIQAILLGDCDAALVGAAAIPVPQSIPYYFEPGMPFSSDGHCRPFDAKASGTVFGSGAAIVALKRLTDAINDGDHIHAIIRSVATNNDGSNRASMSAPSIAGQTRVIRDALEMADIDPGQICYIEAHGTATPIGDPIEIKALANAFIDRPLENTCYLGSVKGNIGHLGWAAGMASLIKAVLITQHKIIPPTINFEQYNPQLHIEETPFTINKDAIVITEPRVIVGVSSFGLGGNNSHIIIEEAPKRSLITPSPYHERAHLLPISARNSDSLQQLRTSYLQFLENQEDSTFPIFVANLQHSRTFFEKRAFVIASHREDAISTLDSLSLNTKQVIEEVPKIALMFSGQGGEHQNMGMELYTYEALFKKELDKFDPVCLKIFDTTAANLLFDPQLNERIINDITCSQPMIFALQVAMARLLLNSGLTPAVLFGHSLGEYAAACIAGVFSAEQGFKILVERSRLLDSLGNIGAMISLECDHTCALKLIKSSGNNFSIAAINTANNTVVSGTLETADQLMQIAAEAGVKAVRLNISRPGHSWLLDPLLDRFEEYLANVELSSPTLPFISTVTGKLAESEVTTTKYWCRQLRETVNFKASVDTTIEIGGTHLIEIGPKGTLSGLILGDVKNILSVLPISRGGRRDHRQFLTVLGELFYAGININFPHNEEKMPVLEGLPTYPFQRVRCWIEAPDAFHSLENYCYQLIWQPLTVEKINVQSTISQKVLFLAPDEILNNTEIGYLKNSFQQFHIVDLNTLITVDMPSDETLKATTAQNFNMLWQKYSDGVDKIYLDLRNQLNNDISTAITTCSLVLNFLQSIINTYKLQPQICLLFSKKPSSHEDMTLSPVTNSIIGMLRSLLIEEPNLKVNVINFAREEAPQNEEEASPIQLLPLTEELVVTVLRNQIFVPRVEKVEKVENTHYIYPTEQDYILIGGAGGIGVQLIKNLCADQVRSIHVIGRSAHPNKELSELMDRYPIIQYLGFDLSTETGYKKCNDWLQSTSIHKAGVFNLAVDLNDKLFGSIQSHDLTLSFNSKCTSILNLYQLLCKHKVEISFIFNFSSATSVLGNGGQSSYGAASAFLDVAHAALFPAAGKVFTVNWGVWRDAGKLRDDQQRIQRLESDGLFSHNCEQGLLFIRLLLASPARIIAFMKIDPKVLSNKSPLLARFLENLVDDTDDNNPSSSITTITRLLACRNESQMSCVLETWLMSTIDALIGLEESIYGQYDTIKNIGLKAMGFDSLAIVQLKNAIAVQLDLQWTAKQLYSYQTLSELHTDLLSHIIQPAWHEAHRVYNGITSKTEQNFSISLQQSRWLSLIDKNYGLRIIPYLIYCPFNLGHCRTALAKVIDEHRLLRTYFPRGLPSVKTTSQIMDDFETLSSNLSSLTTEEKIQQITFLIQEMEQRLPKPKNNITWTIHFIDVGEPFFIALLGVQHLEFDGKSLTLFFDVFGKYLHCLSNNKLLDHVEHKLDYNVYAQRQKQYLHKQWNNDSIFFKGLYNSFKGPTVLPNHPGFMPTIARSSSRHSIEAINANRALNELSELYRFSVFHAILYVYAKSMADIIGQDQLIISTISSGRGLGEFNDIIGPFTSPLPVPLTVSHDDWLTGISIVARTLDAIHDYPLMHPSMLISKIPAFAGLPIDTYFSDIGINFLNYRHITEESEKIRIEGIEILGPVSANLLSGANVEDMRRVPGLHLVVEINGDDLRFNFWFHSERFTTAEVDRWGKNMLLHLKQLLFSLRKDNEQ